MRIRILLAKPNYLYRWKLHSTDVKCWANSESSVADPQHFNADSDPAPAFYSDTDPDPDPLTFRSDADAIPDPDPIFQFDSNPDPDPTTNCFPDLEVGTSNALNWPSKTSTLYFDAYPDPVFHFDANWDPDPDPAFHFDVDPDLDQASQTDAHPYMHLIPSIFSVIFLQGVSRLSS